MASRQLFRFHLSFLAASALQLALGAAQAVPLSATGQGEEPSEPPAWSLLAPEHVVHPDDRDPSSGAFVLGATVPESSPMRQPAWNDLPFSRRDFSQPGDPGLAEQLRSLVNVQPGGTPATRQAAGGRQGNPAPMAGFDLGTTADEWLRDTVQSLVQSAVRIESAEPGRVSFSLFGFGDFSLSVSADRSQIALTEGGDVLFVTQRAAAPGSAVQGGSGTLFGRAPDTAPISTQPVLTQALELVADVASHPVSLLVYCIVAAYALLWSILSRQRRSAPARAMGSMRAASPASLEVPDLPRRRTRKHSTSRRSSGPRGEATHAQPSAVKQRKRIRVRARVHRVRSSGS